MLWVYDHAKYGNSFSTWAVYTSDYDVYRRQILTYKDGPRAQGVNITAAATFYCWTKRNIVIPFLRTATPAPTSSSVHHSTYQFTKKFFIKSPPTMWWWRLIVFAESAPRRRHLFLLSLENPYSDYFQIFAVRILALGNSPGNFFFAFPSFFNKIQDGRKNPMSLSIA